MKAKKRKSDQERATEPTEIVGDFGGRVKAFEREFTEELARKKKRATSAAQLERWAVRRMARLAAVAASIGQRKRGVA